MKNLGMKVVSRDEEGGKGGYIKCRCVRMIGRGLDKIMWENMGGRGI